MASHPDGGDGRGMQVLSWEPRIFLYRRLLSEEECDHLIQASEPRLHRSGVVDADSGGSKIDNIRTSAGMFFERGEDEVIAVRRRRRQRRRARAAPVLHV